MHVENAREIPEYEIDPNELDFTNSVNITKGTFIIARWRGIQVAVKKFSDEVMADEDKLWGDLCAYLKRKGVLKPSVAVRFALDIARGMNYLHEHKPEAIIHRDLEPSNILRDDTRHLKVADFGVSKLLKLTKTVREERPLTCLDTSCRTPRVDGKEFFRQARNWDEFVANTWISCILADLSADCYDVLGVNIPVAVQRVNIPVAMPCCYLVVQF